MKTEIDLQRWLDFEPDYLRGRIHDALQSRKTALKFWCAISYRQATNRVRKARQALRRHNSRRYWLTLKLTRNSTNCYRPENENHRR